MNSRFKVFIKAFLKKRKRLKKCLEKIERSALALFNPLFSTYFIRRYLKKVRNLGHDTQPFILARGDFGYIILLFNYIYYWEQARGPACLINLSSSPYVEELARLICPETKIIDYGFIGRTILKLFRTISIQFYTFCRVEGVVQLDRPDSLSLYMNPLTTKLLPRTSYISYFDQNLLHSKLSPNEAFLNAYSRFRTYCQINQNLNADYIHLQNTLEPIKPKDSTLKKLEILKRDLKINSPYVVLNINCKSYGPTQQRRSIEHPERYNLLIDYLISQGITVVIQGRNEQPYFKPRENLTDYSRSQLCSLEHDFALYYGCLFSIVSKSGPDSFNPVFNKPFLELNSVEFCYCRPNKNGRYFFKHVFSQKDQKFISWKDIFTSPIYFESSDLIFDSDIQYIEMSEEELLKSGQEFLPLALSNSDWHNISSKQKEFKSLITPFHADHYYVQSVPCNTYLHACEYSQSSSYTGAS